MEGLKATGDQFTPGLASADAPLPMYYVAGLEKSAQLRSSEMGFVWEDKTQSNKEASVG